MISTKNLVRMARKWQKADSANHSNKSLIVDKGCFAIYTIDKRRFSIPLEFLSNSIFQQLFKMSEEEFGLPSEGPIKLPCDSVVMNYIVSLLKRGLAKDLETAVLNSITSYCCPSDAYFHQLEHADQYSLVCGF